MARQVTLIALYGPKPPQLQEVIAICQETLMKQLGNLFHPYDILQVHATIIPLERVDELSYINLYYLKYRGTRKLMDFAGLLSFMRNRVEFPLYIQVGGFENRDYSFRSRNENPYQRSFSFQDNIAMVMGWPIEIARENRQGNDLTAFGKEPIVYSNVLGKMRQQMEAFNTLHKYHYKEVDFDNDFYFRIGLLNGLSLDPLLKQELEKMLRELLSATRPQIIEIRAKDIFLASYEDEMLPLGSTKVWSVTDPIVTSTFVEQLYE
jgi:hypothetical protein